MTPTMPTKMSLLFLLVLTMLISSQATTPSKLKETKMTLYFQDHLIGPNATAAIVTGIPGRVWSFASFGTMFVTDDLITKGPEKDSPQIARGQGITVTSSLDGVNAHVMISIVFTNKKFKGSTLEVQGQSMQVAPVTELAVVAGTGKFRFARGYAIFETITTDPSIGYLLIRCNVTVQHY